MDAILLKLKSILSEISDLKAVRIEEEAHTVPQSVISFALIHEGSPAENIEMSGTMQTHSYNAEIEVAYVHPDPHSEMTILKSIALSNSVADKLAGYPTLDGLVRSVRLQSIGSEVRKDGDCKMRVRVLRYEATVFQA